MAGLALAGAGASEAGGRDSGGTGLRPDPRKSLCGPRRSRPPVRPVAAGWPLALAQRPDDRGHCRRLRTV